MVIGQYHQSFRLFSGKEGASLERNDNSKSESFVNNRRDVANVEKQGKLRLFFLNKFPNVVNKNQLQTAKANNPSSSSLRKCKNKEEANKNERIKA